MNGLNDDFLPLNYLPFQAGIRTTNEIKRSQSKSRSRTFGIQCVSTLLVDGNVDFSIRTGALYSYVQGIGNRSFKGKLNQLRIYYSMRKLPVLHLDISGLIDLRWAIKDADQLMSC